MTFFDLASLAKPLVTAPLALAHLDLDKDRRGVLGFTERAEALTVRQLLSHSSGLPPWFPYRPGCLAEDLAAFSGWGRHALLTPGRVGGFLYSDLGYRMLAELLARETGQSFAALGEAATGLLAAPLVRGPPSGAGWTGCRRLASGLSALALPPPGTRAPPRCQRPGGHDGPRGFRDQPRGDGTGTGTLAGRGLSGLHGRGYGTGRRWCQMGPGAPARPDRGRAFREPLGPAPSGAWRDPCPGGGLHRAAPSRPGGAWSFGRAFGLLVPLGLHRPRSFLSPG